MDYYGNIGISFDKPVSRMDDKPVLYVCLLFGVPANEIMVKNPMIDSKVLSPLFHHLVRSVYDDNDNLVKSSGEDLDRR